MTNIIIDIFVLFFLIMLVFKFKEYITFDVSKQKLTYKALIPDIGKGVILIVVSPLMSGKWSWFLFICYKALDKIDLQFLTKCHLWLFMCYKCWIYQYFHKIVMLCKQYIIHSKVYICFFKLFKQITKKLHYIFLIMTKKLKIW